MVQLIIYEKGSYVYSDCVYKDVSVEVAQNATYDEVEDAIIKQCFPEGFVAVIAGKCDASCPLFYPLNWSPSNECSLIILNNSIS